MNFRARKQARSSAALEITPLVDVVFLLLIFFLLTATYVKNPNIDIDLPKASSSEVFNKDNDITVLIKKDGGLKLGDIDVTIEQIEKEFKSKFNENNTEQVIIVKADKGAKHGRVVEIMDLAKKTGFSKLAIAVENP